MTPPKATRDGTAKLIGHLDECGVTSADGFPYLLDSITRFARAISRDLLRCQTCRQDAGHAWPAQ